MLFTERMRQEGTEIDVRGIAPLIERHLGSVDGARVRKFGSGQSNPTYLVETAKRKLVLRTRPPGALLKSAHNVQREFKVMQALESTGVPVPRMIEFLAEDASPIGRDCFLMEHVSGRVFFDPALPSLTRAERATVFDGMNNVLASLGGIDPDGIGLGAFGRTGNYFQRQTSVWTRQYLASRSEPDENMDFVIEWLGGNMPSDDGRVALIHGDFRLDNMIFDGQTLEVLALLDWELSTLGHPIADIAYQCMQWRMPNKGGLRGLGGLDRAALGIPSEDEYLKRFCDRSALPYPQNWTFLLVFGFFRLAAILEGVARRGADGSASNPRSALEYGKSVPVLAEMAADLARRESRWL